MKYIALKNFIHEGSYFTKDETYEGQSLSALVKQGFVRKYEENEDVQQEQELEQNQEIVDDSSSQEEVIEEGITMPDLTASPKGKGKK